MSTVYSVTQINRYIKGVLSDDVILSSLMVRGEVSNLKYHPSGHIYFSLKDKTGTLGAVMFASAARRLPFRMENGETVVCCGRIDLYERDGRYSLYVSEVRREGAGALYEEFLRRRERLRESGMFDAMYKQPVPAGARSIGVVTASSGAAIHDIVTVSRRRDPGVRIILCPAAVQGKEAAPSIARAIRRLDRAGADVIIVGRGGGSIEDLWAFNEEEVVRAVFDCRTPVISAVAPYSACNPVPW